MKEKVVVGMSGGVDSSVAALLLREQGYEVIGVTLDLTGDVSPDAAKVCTALGIEHKIFELRDLFREKIIDYFTNEYISGATPNPCVRCNAEIKFGAMLNIANSLGADKIATGHYARTEKHGDRYRLLRSDSAKDQSYFLSMLNQKQLSSAVFPLADTDKTYIRELAEKNSLPVAHKKDSQEVCFIPDNNYVNYICTTRGIEPREGNFLDVNGRIIGTHKGIINYTVGQRKGLGAFGRPVFVTRIDAINNTVILGDDGEQYSQSFVADNINWIYYDAPPSNFRADVKIRFRAKPEAASVSINEDGSAYVVFDNPQRSVTPGQTAVFYSGDYVLGGGRIR